MVHGVSVTPIVRTTITGVTVSPIVWPIVTGVTVSTVVRTMVTRVTVCAAATVTGVAVTGIAIPPQADAGVAANARPTPRTAIAVYFLVFNIVISPGKSFRF